jgi:hypothetical protein
MNSKPNLTLLKEMEVSHFVQYKLVKMDLGISCNTVTKQLCLRLFIKYKIKFHTLCLLPHAKLFIIIHKKTYQNTCSSILLQSVHPYKL